MGNNVREEIMDLDLNQEPLESSHGSMLGLGSLLNELETTHGRIEERIRQLEAVTSRARQRQRWRQGQTTPQIMNISSETLTVNVHNEGSLLTEEAGIGPQESSAENGKISKRDRTHLIAKALGMDTDVKKGGKDSSGFFDCNICLDMARDPILTCCGHLFCWPCFYQLSCAYSNVKECPVCNGEVTDASIIPIYGNGGNNSTHKSKSEESVLKVPPRPHAQRIESVRQQLINQGAFSAPIEESIQQLRSIIGAMGERTRSQDLDGARITSERSNFLTNHYRTSQRLPTVETEGSRHHPFNQGAYFSPLEEGIQQSRSVIAAMGEQTRSLNVDDTQVSSERRNFLANHYHTSQRLPTTETEGNVDGTQVLSERINFLANHYHTSQRLPTTVSEGNQRQRSLQVSRLLLQGAASFSSLSSALNSAMDSAERLVEDLEAYISSRNRRRSRQESSQTIDRDSLSRIAAVVQADSRNPDTAAEINSAVPPSAVSPGGPDVNAAVAYIETSTLSHQSPLTDTMADQSTPLVDQLASVTINDNGPSSSVQKAQFSDRVPIRSIVTRPDGGSGLAGQRVRVGGWVKTGREQGKGTFAFLEVNDGSCPANLQVIVEASVADLGPLVPTGTCVSVEGVLKLPPEGTKQKIELRVEKVLHVGPVDPVKYPIPKTKLTLEFLRDLLHLRSRTNTISAVARIRNALAFATHSFFQEHGFLYVHTPIITTSDCEGAGEMFQVTTLINDAEKLEKELIKNPPPSEADIETAKLLVKEKGEAVAQLKAAKASKQDISASVGELTKAKENLSKLEERSKLKPGIPQKEGKIDYSQDFFARQAFLTVSGQLQVETYACAVSSVYTFGPTFRAEHSHTSRHLAEFWMVEPEIAFADLQDDMNCAEAYVKYLCQWLLDKCLDDMQFMAKSYDKGCIDRLSMVASTPFVRISYTEAVELLQDAVKDGKKFENKVEWGIDLASEHERYLTEVKFQKPVIVYNYPKGIKAFYMRLNDDDKTVAAMDVLVPKVGELIGGSQREERYDVIRERINEMGLPFEPYEWYLDLRRYGTVKHSGFGLGFERMILFATGIDNIRDVIPFPRYPGRADL